MKRITLVVVLLLTASLCFGAPPIVTLLTVKSPSGGASPTKLFDSINVTGEGGWIFDTTNAPERFAGQENVVFGVNTTITKFILPMTGGFWSQFTTFKVFVYAASGNDTGSLIGSSDAIAGDNTWAHTNVTFTCTTPIVVNAQTVHILIGNADQSGAQATNTQVWYTTPSVISGQMTLYSSGSPHTSTYPSTFPGYDVQMQIWGTTP